MTGWEFLSVVGAVIWGVSWSNVAAIAAAGVLLVMLIRWHRAPPSETQFDFNDLFLDDRTRKAALYKLVIAVLAGLTVWAVVTLIEREHPGDAVTLMIAALGWFIGGRAVTSVWGKPPDPPPPPPESGSAIE